jgi:hypothetical protein
MTAKKGADVTPSLPVDTDRLLGWRDTTTDMTATPPLLLQYMTAKGADLASAATLVITGYGNFYHVTGTTGITDIDFFAPWDGRIVWLEFDGSLLLTHNGTTLNLPGGDNIQTTAGDRMCLLQDSGDNIHVLVYVPANRAFVTSKALTADFANSTVTASKVTNLDIGVGPGRYIFEYYLRYQTAAATTGVKLSVNHTGTVGAIPYQTRHINAAATITNAPSQNENLTTAGAMQGHSARAKSTAAGLGPTLSVDTLNADMLMIVEGILVVTVAGNLELYWASEVAASAATLKDGTSLRLTKTG